MNDLTVRLRLRLRSEGVRGVQIEANEVHLNGGQLAAVYAMTFAPSLSREQKMQIDGMARDEIVEYLQTQHRRL